jgi:hypothetical protein
MDQIGLLVRLLKVRGGRRKSATGIFTAAADMDQPLLMERKGIRA